MFTSDLDSDQNHCHAYIVKTKIEKLFCLVILKSDSNCSFFLVKDFQANYLEDSSSR